MELLNGTDLYKMFQYGAVYVTEERKHLNDINVFPVPDGDTGNNLVHTLKTIIRESSISESFIDQLDYISNSALIGARGNSGVIFAQFVNGLRKSSPIKDEIEIDEFIDMVEEGYLHTYNSLSNPVEGTILTIIKDFGEIMKSLVQKGVNTLQELFSNTYEEITSSLQLTTKQLDVLKDKGVVDSGALGFCLFVKGIKSYFDKDEIETKEYEDVEIVDEHHFEGEITYQYCTEGLIEKNDFDVSKMKHELSYLGDSIVIADGVERTRVHIHTNHPENVFELLNNYGNIESQKVDDMYLEMNLKNWDSKRVIVTDSIADIDPQFLKENNVVVIPVNIDFDKVTYLDKTTITNDMIFNKLDTLEEYPKTATPTIKYINNLFNKLFLMFQEVIVIAVSEKLSGTYRVIKNEAKKLQEKGKDIFVVDSKNNSATEGLLVKRAVDLLKTEMSTKEIVSILEKERNQTEILVCLNSFEYAMKSGRVPKVVGKIGMLLGLRPIMSLDNGKGTAYGFGFSQKQITKKIVKQVKKDLKEKGIKEYSIVHCQNEELALEYKKLFTEIIGKGPVSVSGISSAIAIFSGIGTVAIGYIKE